MSKILDVVDDMDRIVGAATKEDIIKSGQRYRGVHIYVINKDGEMLVQWRSIHKSSPRTFTSSVSGTVEQGESYEQAAKRELKEELGIINVPLQEIGMFRVDEEQPAWGVLYVVDYDGEVVGWEEEADVIDSWDYEEADYMLARFPYLLAPSFRISLSTLFENMVDEEEISGEKNDKNNLGKKKE